MERKLRSFGDFDFEERSIESKRPEGENEGGVAVTGGLPVQAASPSGVRDEEPPGPVAVSAGSSSREPVPVRRRTRRSDGAKPRAGAGSVPDAGERIVVTREVYDYLSELKYQVKRTERRNVTYGELLSDIVGYYRKHHKS